MIRILAFLGFIFLYIPIISLIIFSFNSSNIITNWADFSFIWYEKLFQDQEIISSLWVSIKIAAFSATGSALIGCLMGLALQRVGIFRGKSIIAALLPIPLVVPEVITGFTVSLVFISFNKWFGIPEKFGYQTVILAHMVIGVTYIALMVQAKLADLDSSLEEAALNLGAKPFTVMRLITFPLIAPALFSGWLLSFTISLDDLIIASFTSGAGVVTLPMLIFSRIRFGISPVLNAMASIIIAFVFVVTFIGFLVNLRKKKI